MNERIQHILTLLKQKQYSDIKQLSQTFSPHRRGIPSLNPDFREFVRIAESKKIMYKFYNIPRDKNNIFEGFTSRCLKRNAV